MIVQIQPTTVSGYIHAPASKSSMQRACAAALLHRGVSNILNPGNSNDDLAALDVIQKLGATISAGDNGSLRIESNGVNPTGNEISCGESGLGIRMFTPIASLSSKPLTIAGSGSLVTRPMNFFNEIFPQLGIEIQSDGGKLPLKIKGPLVAKDIEVDGSLSSQFLTGLLMAYSSVIKEQVTIKVNNLKSKPYIDLTLQVMKDFKMNVPENNNYESFTFSPQDSPLTTDNRSTYIVEGDWSGAAFLLVTGAIAGDIIVQGLDVSSTQADKKIMEALMACGCSLSVQNKQINVGPGQLKPFDFDATDCPDLFPPLVALASYCNGTTVIKGTGRLQHKESNRALTLQEEFRKMGVQITLKDDLMLVKGGDEVSGAKVHSRHDHRIAMACAVAALKAKGDVEIEDAQAINKSYPAFYEHLQKLGVKILVK